MIYTVGGIKGGTGKTTIATNLAVWLARLNFKVLLVDADEQRSATLFTRIRNLTQESSEEQNVIPVRFTSIILVGNDVRTQVLQMKRDYDHIVIDTGGRDTTSLRAAMLVSDMFLIPFQPRCYDAWTCEAVQKILFEIRSVRPDLLAFSFLNRADTRSQDNRDCGQVLNEMEGFDFLDTAVRNRKSFATAASKGLSVLEDDAADRKAIKEIEELFQAITDKTIVHAE